MEKYEPREDQKNILKCIASLQSGLQNNDLNLVMSFFEPDAVVCIEPGNPVSSVNGLKEVYKQVFKCNPSYEFGSSQLLINRDIASYSVQWVTTISLKTGEKLKHSGLSTTVFKKQRDGKWLIALDNPHVELLINESCNLCTKISTIK